ncbi:MAG: hypothetical protein E7672_04990 [Ruminococcaceae bacterium]|nr:hypothetical protein [Oscillospiraceae bacterium]
MPSYNRLLVASAKGGVGKSTTALGLAVSYAALDKNVILLDLDVNSRSLDILTGCEDRAVFDLGDILDNDIDRVVIKDVGGCKNLSLIKACTSDRLSSLAAEKDFSTECVIRKTVEKIISDTRYDIVICDTGGGIEIASSVADLFGLALVTSEQSQTSLRAAEYAGEKLVQSGSGAVRLVICSFDLNAVKKEKRAGVVEMIDSSSLRCVGVVPFDKKLQSVQDKGTLPGRESLAQTAYGNIARRIMGYDIPLFSGMRSLEKKKRFAF